MNLLVDGHNLIGQMPGINLSDADDEAQLVMRLRSYATAKRSRNVVVVFDHGVYGHPQRLDGYGITCYFARSPQDADTQLIRRIQALERPGEWRVVTSDRQVASAARSRGVRVISAQAFVLQLNAPAAKRPVAPPGEAHDTRLSPAEVNEWLKLFGEPAEETPEPPQAAPEPAPKTPARPSRKRVRKK